MMRIHTPQLAGTLLALILLASLPLHHANADRNEPVKMSSEAFAKLDTFEGHTLNKADKVFVAEDYRRAAAEYDSFLLEFPRSAALPYALLRKARCLHLEGKRFEAVREYRQVLDFFPDDVKYAAAALFYIGQAHWQNGDEEAAIKAWAQLADDAEYAREPLAASAVNAVAGYMKKTGHEQEAVDYYMQVARDFRTANPDAAYAAIWRAVPYYIRTKPNEPKLRQFYTDVQTFHRNPRKVDDAAKEKDYWKFLRDQIKHRDNTQFTSLQKEQKDRYYRHWADVLAKHMTDWDDMQIDRIDFMRQYEGNEAAWIKRLDEFYAKHQTPDAHRRTVRWIQVYAQAKNTGKVDEYYQKLDFAKMPNIDIMWLARVAQFDMNNPDMAKRVHEKIRFKDLTDAQIYNDLLRHFWHRDSRWIWEPTVQRYNDQDAGRITMLHYLQWRHYHYGRQAVDLKEGLEIADILAVHPDHAERALRYKAELLYWSSQWEKALAVYKQTNNAPHNYFRIATCFAKMGKLAPAVGQLREIENFHKTHASQAALQMAYLYRDAGQRDQFIATLRRVLKQYPQSNHSSTAHQELERLGVAIGGGTDAE